MPKYTYQEKNLRGKVLDMIAKVGPIIDQYAAQGFDLTLRQIYYYLVSHDLFPDDLTWRQIPGTNKWVKDPNGTKNAEPNYKWLGDVVSDGRLCGLIDWDAIVDRTRFVRENSHWSGPSEIVAACAEQFKINKWENQNTRCLVLVEKDALVGVIEGISRELDVPCISCRGYTSQTAMWGLGQRIAKWIDEDYEVQVFHLGDHDPSGIDMSRDIEERLKMFVGAHAEDEMMGFKRLALNMDQVDEYSPPPNPAKLTDSRANAYVAKYGNESWELDALEPSVLVDLVRDAVLEVRNEGRWEEAVTKENGFKALLSTTAASLKKKEKKA